MLCEKIKKGMHLKMRPLLFGVHIYKYVYYDKNVRTMAL